MRKEKNIRYCAEENQNQSHYKPLVKLFELLLEWEIKEQEEMIQSINKNEN